MVEQGHFVQAGRENFEDGSLCFRNTIADAVDGMRPNVALLSGVLQYIPNAAGILAELVSTGIETIVIDRTPFVDDDATIISVQHVPSRIVKSSYPTYLFSQSNLLGDAWQNYRILVEFEAIDRTIFSLGRRIVFKGMILVKR